MVSETYLVYRRSRRKHRSPGGTVSESALTLEIGMFTGYGAAVMLMDSGIRNACLDRD